MMALSGELVKALLGDQPANTYDYNDPFAVQNRLDAESLDRALAQSVMGKDKLILGGLFSSEGGGIDPMIGGRAEPTVVNNTPTAQGILDKTQASEVLGLFGKFLPAGLGMIASGAGKLMDYKASSDFDRFNETQDRNTSMMRGGGLTKSDMEGNVWGFNPSNDTYVSSDGRSFDTTTMSPETQAGLAANLESFGTGTDKDYYGD